MDAKRGYVPEDERNFSAEALEVMKTASRQIFFLLNEGYDFTFVKDEKEFMSVVASLQKKVDELNKKYPKTVKYAVVGKLSAQEGSITIGTVGTAVRTKGIFLKFWCVRPMTGK